MYNSVVICLFACPCFNSLSFFHYILDVTASVTFRKVGIVRRPIYYISVPRTSRVEILIDGHRGDLFEKRD